MPCTVFEPVRVPQAWADRFPDLRVGDIVLQSSFVAPLQRRLIALPRRRPGISGANSPLFGTGVRWSPLAPFGNRAFVPLSRATSSGDIVGHDLRLDFASGSGANTLYCDLPYLLRVSYRNPRIVLGSNPTALSAAIAALFLQDIASPIYLWPACNSILNWTLPNNGFQWLDTRFAATGCHANTGHITGFDPIQLPTEDGILRWYNGAVTHVARAAAHALLVRTKALISNLAPGPNQFTSWAALLSTFAPGDSVLAASAAAPIGNCLPIPIDEWSVTDFVTTGFPAYDNVAVDGVCLDNGLCGCLIP